MKVNNKVSLVLLFLVALCQAATGQDLKEELIKMKEQYGDMSSLHVVMLVSVFDEQTASSPYYKEKVEIKKQDESFLYVLTGNEMLLNKKYMVMVDKSEKQIVWSERDPQAETAWRQGLSFDLDSILSYYHQATWLKTENGIAHYSVLQKEGPVDWVYLFIDTNTHLIHKMEYHYKNDQFVSILFKEFKTHPVFTEATFDEKRYVVNERGEFKASGVFRQYRVTEVTMNQ